MKCVKLSDTLWIYVIEFPLTYFELKTTKHNLGHYVRTLANNFTDVEGQMHNLGPLLN